ncbi:UDP-2,4-diacetamido-2,4,6-trideoxy-beta-L-altropyranose hydrolase [Pelagibius sp. Alg239-R121]|uniref:UDP-2,4-diacetamido-2,4, 6-trideoxy-beta-L-altropyranose hydrolase n=1 Tax=Pelagibius sp. Alg239-R121 TaxID=2993448 RepID=UPI0024A6C90F|nr:UDP-2,4-diacetamido-2,4,6-trideoxy-beta-L-altropyranose hydrolase [Pelagibius sp. Alg239-R121]
MFVAFRADASEQIGSGHLMRCITLADTLKESGAQTRFLCHDLPDSMWQLVKARGHQLMSVKSPETDAAASSHLLSDRHWDWLIVDHYGLDIQWETFLRRRSSKIMVIDDLANRRHDCDMLLDQNYRKSDRGRYANLVPPSCSLRLGPKYALLHRDYARLRASAEPRESVKRLLIYFGGSDLADLTSRSLRAAVSLGRTDLKIDVVSSQISPRSNEVRKIADDHPSITCHQNLPSLAPLIAASDLSIGAMGSTSWERMCLGVPTIGVILADNQKEVAAELQEANLAVCLGTQENVNEEMIAGRLRRVVQSRDFRTWSERCMSLCDGRGTHRIAESLINDAKTASPVLTEQTPEKPAQS